MNTQTRHVRARASLILAALLAAGSAIAAGPASASASPSAQPVLTTAHTVSGCGEPLTVRTPTPAAAASATSLAAALNLHANDPLVQLTLQRHTRWLDNVTCKARPGVVHLASAQTPSSANWLSQNWSGYVAGATNPTEVYGQWAVPSVSYSGSGTGTQYSSIWPGMGGWNGESGELIQDGTEQDAWCNARNSSGACSAAGSAYAFWFELYPLEPEQVVTNLVPSAGDSVYAMSSFTTPNAYFYLCDLTQNACVYGSQSSLPPGNSIEWIIERPQVGGTWYPLPNFGTATLTNNYGYWGTSGAGTPANLGVQSIDMYKDSTYKVQLDSTGALGSDGATFSERWLRSQ